MFSDSTRTFGASSPRVNTPAPAPWQVDAEPIEDEEPQPAAAQDRVATYWAAGSQAFNDVDEIRQALAEGRLQMPRDGSALNVQKLVYADAATIQKSQKMAALRSGVSAALCVGAGVGLSMLFTSFAPIHFLSNAAFLVGGALGCWNGAEAYTHFQTAKATVYDGYMTAEKGRITTQPGTQPAQMTYQPINDKSVFNVIPDHPLAWRQAVPLQPAS